MKDHKATKGLLDLLFSPKTTLVAAAVVLPITSFSTIHAWLGDDPRAGTMALVTLVLFVASLVPIHETRRKRRRKNCRSVADRQLDLVLDYRERQSAVIQRMKEGDAKAFTEFDRHFGEQGRAELEQQLYAISQERR